MDLLAPQVSTFFPKQDYSPVAGYGITVAGGNMRFRQLPVWCRECGGPVPARIKQVGLTPRHELVVHFLCLRCRKHAHFVKPLADCWRDCPSPDDELTAPEPGAGILREPDAKFLHSLGVAFPEDGEP